MWRRTVSAVALSLVLSAPSGAEDRPTTVGEAFGQPVSADEFAYYYKTALALTQNSEHDGRDEATIRREAWRDLILSHEADRLGIRVERADLEEALTRLVGERGGEYRSPGYAAWVTAALGEDVPTFERRVEDLLRINRLIKANTGPSPTVTDEEIVRQFLDEYNLLEYEYIRFDTRQEAEAFLSSVRRTPLRWKETFDQSRARDGQRGAAWVNLMTVQALKDIWQIPQDDIQRMLDSREGEYLVSTNVYGTVAVRLLRQQRSALGQLNDHGREYYRKRLTEMKQQPAMRAYLDEVFGRARYQDYSLKPGDGSSGQPQPSVQSQ